MNEAAQVRSLEALQTFREALSQFCADARDALASVDMEARRAMAWLGHEQSAHWKRSLLERQEDVQHAKADLTRKKLAAISGREPDVLEEKEALRIAHLRVAEAEEKLDLCSRWARDLYRAADDYHAPARQLATLVEGQPAPAIAQLDQIIEAVENYLAVSGS
jgi:hypothetical protein